MAEIAGETRDRREEGQLGLRERWARRVLSGKLDGELSALVVSVSLSMKFIARHAYAVSVSEVVHAFETSECISWSHVPSLISLIYYQMLPPRLVRRNLS